MAKNTFKLEGVEESIAKINAVIKNTENVSRKTFQAIAADLKGKAIEKTPTDTGDLKGSAYYRTEVTRNGVTAEVGFTSPYGIVQHESLEFNHPQGGEPKFLENAFKENVDKYIEEIKQSVRSEVV